MIQNILELTGVSKAYADGTVIGEVSFAAGRGECVALCGGNGAGKSTIIRMIAGLLSPSTGEILICGHTRSQNKNEYNKNFSYVPENITLPGSLTAREVLVYYASLLGLPDERAREVCEVIGLLKFANKKITDYSKGMKQRLVIAQALLAQPPLLILDEPSNGLDLYWSIRFKEMIKDLIQSGVTVLLTSHILSDIEELADRVILLNDGKIIENDTLSKLFKKYGRPSYIEQIFLTVMKED